MRARVIGTVPANYREAVLDQHGARCEDAVRITSGRWHVGRFAVYVGADPKLPFAVAVIDPCYDVAQMLSAKDALDYAIYLERTAMIPPQRMVDAKLCARCGLQKLVTEFARNKARGDGRDNYCRACRREYQPKARISRRPLVIA